MKAMFRNATAFNQPLGDWDVSKVTDMSDMFNDATIFNQEIGGWDADTARVDDAFLNSGLRKCPSWADDKNAQGPCKADPAAR